MIEPAQSDGSMSDLQQAPRHGGDYAGEVAEPARLAVPGAPRRPARWSARRRRDAWLLLVALLLGVATIFVLVRSCRYIRTGLHVHTTVVTLRRVENRL